MSWSVHLAWPLAQVHLRQEKRVLLVFGRKDSQPLRGRRETRMNHHDVEGGGGGARLKSPRNFAGYLVVNEVDCEVLCPWCSVVIV